MPRPRVTFSRNGITSSWPSGPRKESTSSASRRPAGAGWVEGSAPPLLRTASEGSWSGCWPALMSTSDANGMETPVDVHDLAGGGGEPVRQQRDDGLARGLGVGDRPAQRGATLPGLLELHAAGDRLHGHAAQRAGGDDVRPDALGAQLARHVAA